MKQINMRKAADSLVVTHSDFTFIFRWLDGSLDIYSYRYEYEFKAGLRNHLLYEDPAESSGRVVWCSNEKLLAKLRADDGH